MDFDLQWLLLALPAAFALGWLASRIDLRNWKREVEASPRAYFKGLNLLLNEQQDKAIDAFIEAVQQDPGSSDLHFALGNLFRRRGEYERAVRVHQHLLGRADLPTTERDRAQHALAQDYLKAGLFDRAEAAYKALEGTAFATEARLALLNLHERSRDWKAAIEVARGLESAAVGSFSQRVAHYGCELALESDAQGDTAAAQAALQRAREAAPQSARPLILAGQRLARGGQHAEALALWTPLSTIHPEAFGIVAKDYASSAQACGQQDDALARLKVLHAKAPTSDLLDAILSLEPDAQERRRLLLQQVQGQHSLSAALSLVNEPAPAMLLTEAERSALQQALTVAAKPLRRYRCAACGFEAQQYFWQCPGCHGWDTFPPRRLEDH
ncbi:lipopolysaccharide assembly protein LapB [Sphaerotilus mobilis]|uniref:Lipopolysaccharide assembly protein B n=1 Tax=Sphaerotilus mobilis TaxID=47994 RepID=A0A4Q7LCV5_9BURK|nr:lipopolysaccharide assembly protein LapB [Sphaerotilus mobilis]RZS47540.1 lipopolysaccharide biosynthesis regulator YciM [Sphaerotilus mobilis]